MSTLLDVAERLQHNLACIRQVNQDGIKRSRPEQTAGPFTEAVLSARPLITYLRDAYTGESRLLTVHSGTEDGNAANKHQVEGGPAGGGFSGVGRTTPQKDGSLPDVVVVDRRQIVSATPFRRRKEVGPSGEGGDVFLKSALKLIER